MDYTEKAFAQTADASKQLITIGTAIIAFCATFVNVKIGDHYPFEPTAPWHRIVVVVGAVSLFISVGAGTWTQLALADVLIKQETLDERRLKYPYRIQIVAFAVGVLMLALYWIARIL